MAANRGNVALCGVVKPEHVFDTVQFPAPEWNEEDKCARCRRTYMMGLGIVWKAWRPFVRSGHYGPWSKKMHAFAPASP